MKKEELSVTLKELLERATEPFQFCTTNKQGVRIWVVADPIAKTWRSQLHQEPGVGLAPRKGEN